MIEDSSLHMIIHEEIFLVNEKDQPQQQKQEAVTETPEPTAPLESSSAEATAPIEKETPGQVNQEQQRPTSEEPEILKPAAPEPQYTTEAARPEAPAKSDQLFIATEVLNDAGNELINKITSSVGLTKNDYKVSIGSSAGIPQHKRAIIFTKNPKMPLYEVSNFKGTQLLVSKSLEELEHSRDEKLKLWNALKEWYGV